MSKKIYGIIYILFLLVMLNFLKIFETIQVTGFEYVIKNIGNVISMSVLLPIYIFKNIIYVLVITGLFFILIYLYKPVNKNFRKNEEFGSASWADVKDLDKLKNKKFELNKILSLNCHLDLNEKRKNLNSLHIGSSGSGKSSNIIIPNILQAHTSYVITDPKGELYNKTSIYLKNRGYKVSKFDLVNMKQSSNYNPFEYIKDDNDIFRLINVLIKNTTAKNASQGDPFWEKAETALIHSLYAYTWHFIDKEEQNMTTIMDMLLELQKTDKMDEPGPIAFMFDKLEVEHPNHIALRQWRIFDSSTGRTRSSILVSVGVRLAIFNNPDLKQLVSKDTLSLDKLGNEKTVLYIIIPDTDSTFNFLAAMLYTQLFQLLVYEADIKSKGSLPVHVRFLLDEFANIGEIPDFEKLIATIRSRNMSVDIIVQALTQLKTRYKDTYETIVGNCDSLTFLGGTEQSTLQFIEKKLGKETIDYSTTSSKTRDITREQESTSYNITGRSLLTSDEISRLPLEDSIVFIRGERPILDNKFFYKEHNNANELVNGSAVNKKDVLKNKSIEIKKFIMNEQDISNIVFDNKSGEDIDDSILIKEKGNFILSEDVLKLLNRIEGEE